MESTWRSGKSYVNGSYTWSHYYGNFDQDNTSFSPVATTPPIFIGSSNIARRRRAPAVGLQVRRSARRPPQRPEDQRRRTTSRGRPRVGAFALYQSGQPYQLESLLPYRPLTGSTSDTNRYAEPAGSRALARASSARSEVHAEHRAVPRNDAPAHRRHLQRLRQADGIRLRDPRRHARIHHAHRRPYAADSASIPASVLAALNLAPGSQVNAPFRDQVLRAAPLPDHGARAVLVRLPRIAKSPAATPGFFIAGRAVPAR